MGGPVLRGRRDEVLETLRRADVPLSIVEVAERLAVHPNTARFHLEHLVSTGRAERVESTGGRPGRPARRFRALPGMDPTGPQNARLVADALLGILAEDPDPVAAARRAGHRWAARQGDPLSVRRPADEAAVVRHLLEALGVMGFAPEGDPGTGGQIRLRHCPFLDLVDAHGGLVCSLHLGILQGLCDGVEAPITTVRLDPFVEPDLCVAHLGARVGRGPRRRTGAPGAPR